MASPLSSMPKDIALSLPHREQSEDSPEEVRGIVAAHVILSRPLPHSKGSGSEGTFQLSEADAAQLTKIIEKWKQNSVLSKGCVA